MHLVVAGSPQSRRYGLGIWETKEENHALLSKFPNVLRLPPQL